MSEKSPTSQSDTGYEAILAREGAEKRARAFWEIAERHGIPADNWAKPYGWPLRFRLWRFIPRGRR